MPRRRMMDGRNPYGSEGGYVVSSRRNRMNRAMKDYARRERVIGRDRLMMDDMRAYNRGESDYELSDLTRQDQEIRHDPYMPRDYETGEVYAGVDDFYGERDMARGSRYYTRNYGRDYTHGSTYYPVEAMGRFSGYWGEPEQDYARGGRGRNRRDYAMDYNYDYRGRDYRYDYAGDYGENLGKEELEHWNKKLMKEVEDKDKQFFSKEHIMKKAQEMGIKFDKFNQEEFYVTALMMYTDYCKTLGTANMDIYLRLAKDWLEDDDVSVKGGEKLAVYHDCIVEGEEDDD